MMLQPSGADHLRKALQSAQEQKFIIPFLGIHDLFSACLASQRFDALFLSGFGLAASTYGLPDIGFIGWGDLVSFTTRLRALLPNHHVLVDIDDGFGDATVAAQVAWSLERCGASGVVLEDQARPRRCGHFSGKQLMPLESHLEKLRAVLKCRNSLVVVARTDASEPGEILERAQSYVRVGCDAVLADGIKDLALLTQLRKAVDCPVFVNVIGGGKVPPCSRSQLAEQGVQGLIYSTPCLFAAQAAIEHVLGELSDADMDIQAALSSGSQLDYCNKLLQTNLRHARPA